MASSISQDKTRYSTVNYTTIISINAFSSSLHNIKVVYVFLLLSMCSYCCLCVPIVVYVFLLLSMCSYCCLCVILLSMCSQCCLCILIVVYVSLLLSMYSYCCLCILIVVYLFLDAATLTEVFPCFSSVVRQMPGYNQPRRGTARTLPKLVLFYVLFVLCCSTYCLCVNVYCTSATG